MMAFEEFRQGVPYDLVGVAPVERFDGLSPAEHPRSIYPDGRSVVVVGKRIHRGRFRAMEEGTLWQTPGRWLSDLDDVVRLIEIHGAECVPYLPLDTPRLPSRPVRPGQCVPNSMRLSPEHAAVMSGLGEIGYHGMFMSPEFGIRQTLGILVTDLDIEPSPGQAGRVCDGCLACARECPLDAISATETVEIRCGEHTMRLGVANGRSCRSCPNGASGDSKHFAGAEELHVEIENNQVKGEARSPFTRWGLPNRLSAACGRACIARFESTHRTGYLIPFRSRDAWGFRPDEKRGW